MAVHEGGCLCGAVRYGIQGEPLRITVCHCKFCQRATGSAYMVEPIFRETDLQVTKGSPAAYDHCSGGSGKLVHIHFCAACGTKLYLTFERFADVCGVYAGTFDDPNWFESSRRTRSTSSLMWRGTRPFFPLASPALAEHAMRNDGTALEPVVFDQPQIVGSRPM